MAVKNDPVRYVNMFLDEALFGLLTSPERYTGIIK